MHALEPLLPLDTASLMAPLTAELIALLRGLTDEEWSRPTAAGSWTIREVALHLFDGDLRKLSAHRDGHLLAPDRPIAGYADVLALINGLNASGVAYGRRLSSRLLVDLLEVTGRWVSEFIESLDPNAQALFAVAWAGEEHSDNRFDTAREYTERWHHQMQIRAALGDRGQAGVLLSPRFAVPLFETSVRALPYAFREVAAPAGTSLVLRTTDSPLLAWTLRREREQWSLYRGEVPQPSARLEVSPDVLWRLFYNALTLEASREIRVHGSRELLAPLLAARSVMV